MRFRHDILRGVRLFLIAFFAILLAYTVYQRFRPVTEVQGAPQETAPTPEAARPAAVPTAEASSDAPHGLVVPAPPPVNNPGGVPAPPPKVSHARTSVASSVASSVPALSAPRSNRAPAINGREFETPEVGLLPSASGEESTDSNPHPVKSAVGYKSLLEANPIHPAAEAAPTASATEPIEEHPKGNRFARAIGKIFRGGNKKEPIPLTLQQPKP